LAFAQQLQHKLMCLSKDGVVFLTQRGKIVDIEESAVVNVVGRHRPESQSVRLGLDQFVQSVIGAWEVWRAVKQEDLLLVPAGHGGGFFAQSRQSAFMNFLVAQPFGALFRRDLVPTRQVMEGSDQTLQLEKVFLLGAQFLLQSAGLAANDSRILAGIDRKAIF